MLIKSDVKYVTVQARSPAIIVADAEASIKIPEMVKGTASGAKHALEQAGVHARLAAVRAGNL